MLAPRLRCSCAGSESTSTAVHVNPVLGLSQQHRSHGLLRHHGPGQSARHHASRCQATAQGTQQLKAELLKTVSRLNNESVPEQQEELTQTLLSLVKELSAANPTAQPALSPLINGRWAILYTLADSEKPRVQRSPLQAALAAAYNFFFRFVPVIAGSAVGRKSGGRGNFQEFDTVAGTVKNEALFRALGRDGIINVDGTAAVINSAPAKDRLEATFLSAKLKWGDVRLTFPISAFRPTGFVDTLYLDEELRIGRGDKGTVFITRRVS